MCLSRNVALLCIIIIACILLINASGMIKGEGFEIQPPLPCYYNEMKNVQYPYAGGPYYHDAPHWFDMWSARFNAWRGNTLSNPNYDSDTINNGAPVPLPPSQIAINGNKRPNPLERFDCIISPVSKNPDVARPYYSADVSSIYATMDKPADQSYDWLKFKLSGIPASDMNSIYAAMDTPEDQAYDWSKFKLDGIPDNSTKSIYEQLLPTKCN